jgi:hypothetical protein
MKAYKFLVGNPEGKTPVDVDIGGRILLKWVLEKNYGVVWAGLNWLRTGKSGGLL